MAAMSEQTVDYEQAEALGISHEAYDEVLDIVGRIPTVDELSTLMAMWESNGRQQSLYAWLRGQHHEVHRDDYLYTGEADHRAIKEPKVRECAEIGAKLCKGLALPRQKSTLQTGRLLYMVGNVSTEFADSEYARRCLHLVGEAMATSGKEEERKYIELILDAMENSGLLEHTAAVAEGGLFCSLLAMTAPCGFDILTPREVRLDAFLFGEEQGRYLTVVDEKHDDSFLMKLGEARLNCCFLGRTTKNRLLVDGFDMGATSSYVSP